MLFTRLLDMLHKKERGKKKLTVRNNHADIFPRRKAPVATKRLACIVVATFFCVFPGKKENRQNKKKPVKRKIVTNYFLFCLRNSADDNFF